MIESLEEASRNHLEAGVNAARGKYRKAVRPIYGADRNGRPTLFGTCFGLELGKRKYLVTAAHVVDKIAQDGGYVLHGPLFVPLLGVFNCTRSPDGIRDNDLYDYAWKELGVEDVNFVDQNSYISEADICENRSPCEGRVYLVLGYPRSKNKKADPTTQKVRPKMHAYYSLGKVFPKLSASLSLTGGDHLAISYGSLAKTSDGKVVNSIYPRGMSGGPFLDLGRKGSLSDLARDKPYAGRLAGILIEKFDDADALIAVKIDLLVAAIRNSHSEVEAVPMPSLDHYLTHTVPPTLS